VIGARFEKILGKHRKDWKGVAELDANDIREYTETTEAERALCWGPDADAPGTLTEPRDFKLMFETKVGPLADASAVAYLRPETAQGIFVNYKNIVDTGRVKVPFGIAQI